METISVDILDPKAKILLKTLAELNLIRINKRNKKSDFKRLLERLRSHSEYTPSIEEIALEVEER